MKAINDFIVIEKIKQEPKNVGGFIMTESSKKDIRYLKGKIISIGNNTEGLNKDDIIFYDRHAGHNIEYDKNIYFVIKQRDVVLVV